MAYGVFSNIYKFVKKIKKSKNKKILTISEECQSGLLFSIANWKGHTRPRRFESYFFHKNFKKNMNSPAINISRFNGNNTIVVHSTDVSVDGLSPINTGSVVTVHVDTFDQWPVGTIDSFPNNLSSVINDAIPLNYSRIISEYTRSSNSEELLSSFSVYPNLESLQPRILEAFLAAKRSRELRSNNPNLSVNDVQNNMDFSNNLTNVINNVNENRFVEWLQSSLDNPLSSVFTHIFQTWGIDSLAWITDMIHVPGCTSVLLFVTLNHTLSQIWVLLLRGMRGFRLSLLDLVLFYKRLLKKSLQYLHALRTNRLAMVYQNTSEDNITQQPRVPGETQLAITESVNTRIGVVEGLAKIDEENAKIAAAEVLLKKSFLGV